MYQSIRCQIEKWNWRHGALFIPQSWCKSAQSSRWLDKGQTTVEIDSDDIWEEKGWEAATSRGILRQSLYDEFMQLRLMETMAEVKWRVYRQTILTQLFE